MITSQLTDQQKAFNAKMEEIRKVISVMVQEVYVSDSPADFDYIKENTTEQIRNILKDSFIPNKEEVKDPFAQVKGDSFWHTVNNIREEYRQESLTSINILFENIDKLNDRVTELEKRLTETENHFKPFGDTSIPKGYK